MPQLAMRWIPGGRFSFLLVAVMLFLCLHPVMEVRGPFHPVLRGLFCLLLLLAVYASDSRLRTRLLMTLVLVLALAVHWASFLWPDNRLLVVLDGCLSVTLFTLTGGAILYAVFRERRVSSETIAGALCVYLLFGLTWSFLYGLIELGHPGAFHFVPPADAQPVDSRRMEFFLGDPCFSQLVYYSFCTLTTLGLGDIVPQSPLARTFSYMEAAVGQMYLTVLVARLVGLHISQSGRLEGPG